MKKRRSVGVKTVGAIAILFSLINLRFLFLEDFYSYRFSYIFIGLSWFIAAIAILRFKNWGRISVIILTIYEFYDEIILGILNFNENTQYMLSKFSEFSKLQISAGGIIVIISQAILSVVMILYLTRPKVKEQFK